MESAGLQMMRNLEITAKLQTATKELVPGGPTTYTRYVCKVRVNYVLSVDSCCWPGTCGNCRKCLLKLTKRVRI